MDIETLPMVTVATTIGKTKSYKAVRHVKQITKPPRLRFV